MNRTVRKNAELSTEHSQLLNLNDQLLNKATDFVKEIFSYDSLQVLLTPDVNLKGTPELFSGIIFQSSKLIRENEHCRYELAFATKTFGYTLSIHNIPCLPGNQSIKLFLDVVSDFIMQSLSLISSQFQTGIKVNHIGLQLSDFLTLNIKKTILIEYLYTLFNRVDESYNRSSNRRFTRDGYDIKILERIWNYAHELNTIKIENREVFCGFIFQSDKNFVENNSVRLIDFRLPIEFGNALMTKNYLKLSNGQDIFFNVDKFSITSLVMTKNKLKDIYLSPLGPEKRFSGRPLIVSIQGNGRIFFIEGGTERNTLLFQIRNNNPLLRDGDFIKITIKRFLLNYTKDNLSYLELFVDWLLSLSQRNKGTSILIGSLSGKIFEEKAFKFIKIGYPANNFLKGSKEAAFDFSFLDQLILIDGGMILNEYLLPKYVGAMVPNKKGHDNPGTGSRHNSIQNFTKEVNCLGIVISEDGPISIFEKGGRILKI